MKTIFMAKDKLDKWLAALRSGEYKQGIGFLKTEDGKFCCLGVLQHCLTGQVQPPHNETNTTDPSASLPSETWLAQNGIEFHSSLGKNHNLGMAVIQPYLPSLERDAAEANDGEEWEEDGETYRDGQYSFKQIADAIEECAEVI